MWWKLSTQGPIAFVLGAVTFLHEVVLTTGDRPYVITASLALMGFPFVLGFEARGKSIESNRKPEDSPEDS